MKTINEIDKLLGLKRSFDYTYEGTVCTGEFDGLHDYDRGILYVKIQSNEDLNICPMSISTIDDGVWTVSGTLKKDDVEKIAMDFIDSFGQVLPTEEELNTFLKKV